MAGEVSGRTSVSSFLLLSSHLQVHRGHLTISVVFPLSQLAICDLRVPSCKCMNEPLKFIRNYSEFSWVMANNFDNSVAISERVQKKQSKFWSLKNYK
jgi:hypothetical protein